MALQLLAVFVIAFGDIGFDHRGRFGLDIDDLIRLMLLWLAATCAGFWLAWRTRWSSSFGLQCLVFCSVVTGFVVACWPSSGSVGPAHEQFAARLVDANPGTYTRSIPSTAATSPAIVFVVEVPAEAPSRYRGYWGELRIGPRDRTLPLLGRDVEAAGDLMRCELILELSEERLRDEIVQLSRKPDISLELRLIVFRSEQESAESSWMEATQLFKAAAAKLK